MLESLKKVIAEFHEKGVPSFIERDFSIPKFKRINKIFTITGPRRAGKTTLLYQIMKNYIKEGFSIENFLYLNFEDERISDIRKEELNLILEAYRELYGNKKPILFFDEIQNIKGWDKFLRRLNENNYKVYVTGSNSNLLSKEISTSLRGRSFSIELFPLSFKEYLKFRGIKIEKNWFYSSKKSIVKKEFLNYLNLSGYPEIVLENELAFINDYFSTIFYRDIVDRYNVENRELLSFLMKYVVKNYGSLFSINKANNTAKSIGINSSTSTIHSYLSMLSNSYFLFLVPNLSKGKRELTYIKKSYVVDHGFINYLNTSINTGRLLENIVFIELKRRWDEVYFYRNRYECDFVGKEAIQVTYDLAVNKEREYRGLNEAMKSFSLNGSILTFNESSEAIPVWKWLLD